MELNHYEKKNLCNDSQEAFIALFFIHIAKFNMRSGLAFHFRFIFHHFATSVEALFDRKCRNTQ